jgi:hypothetical protein
MRYQIFFKIHAARPHQEDPGGAEPAVVGVSDSSASLESLKGCRAMASNGEWRRVVGLHGHHILESAKCFTLRVRVQGDKVYVSKILFANAHCHVGTGKTAIW